MIHLARGTGQEKANAGLGERVHVAWIYSREVDEIVSMGKRLGDRVLWAVTKSFWWTAASAVVLALMSSHQGVST